MTCPCCGAGPPDLLGWLPFHRSCNDAFVGQTVLEPAGPPVRYLRCAGCGFAWADALCAWSPERLAAEIYNEDYVLTDPPFVFDRPWQEARRLGALLPPRAQHLDFGGGRGLLSRFLRKAGHTSQSWDPFFAQGQPAPTRRFDLVTAFDVAEHATDPAATLSAAMARVAEGGALLVSTLLQPGAGLRSAADLEGWWYAAPRNGHIALHTAASLQALAQRLGVRAQRLTDNHHLFAAGSVSPWIEALAAAYSAVAPSLPPVQGR